MERRFDQFPEFLLPYTVVPCPKCFTPLQVPFSYEEIQDGEVRDAVCAVPICNTPFKYWYDSGKGERW